MRVLVFVTLVAVASASKNGFSQSLDFGNQPSMQLPENIPIVSMPFPEDVQAQAEVGIINAPAPEAKGYGASAAAPAAGLLPQTPPPAVASLPSTHVPNAAEPAASSDRQSNAIDSIGPAAKYQPNWPSIDSRPLPSWYDDAKIGIFIHWGVYSVPSFSSEWFWIDWKGESTSWKNGKIISVSGRQGTAKADYKKHDREPEEKAKQPLKRQLSPAAPRKHPHPSVSPKHPQRPNPMTPLSGFWESRTEDDKQPYYPPANPYNQYWYNWFPLQPTGYRWKRDLASKNHRNPTVHSWKRTPSSLVKSSVTSKKSKAHLKLPSTEKGIPNVAGYLNNLFNFEADSTEPVQNQQVGTNMTQDILGKPSPNEHAKKKIDHFMKANYKPGFSYQDFAKDFTAEFFDPSLWADIIENAGAKYVVFTSKHHEGYALWPSKYSYSWNSVDVGPHRDLVGDLRKAILKKKGIRFGLYHSLYEWFHPLYLSDKSTNFTTKEFVNHKIFQEMKELVNLYKPEVFWSDGEWEAPSEYWRSTEFLAWLYNQSPVKDNVVVNDRWGHETLCKHGGMFTCQDRYNPGKLLQHKWENAMTIDKSTWGFNRMSNLEDYMTTQELVDQLASTVSCGGNIVLNVGPAKDGTINPIFQDRLSGVGKWLKVNGEAIYGSRPWDNCQNDTVTPDVWYTVDKSGTNLYAVMLRWPSTGVLDLGCPALTAGSQVFLLDAPTAPLKAEHKDNVLRVTLPDKVQAQTNWGSVIKITNFNKLVQKTYQPGP